MRRSRHIAVLLLTAILMISIGSGASCAEEGTPPSNGKLRASLDRKTAKVGGVVTLTLHCDLPEEAILPEEIEIRGLEGLTEIERKIGPRQVLIRYIVDRLGAWKSDPITLTYRDENGKARTLEGESVSLNVASNLGDQPSEAALRPLEDILPVRRLFSGFLLWSGIAAGVIVVVLFLLWWRKRQHNRTVVPGVEEPPHIRARKEIEALAAQGLFEKGQVKAFYFSFSEIIRRYLEDIRHFPAAEYTTEEIARKIHLEEDRPLLPLLRRADLVKFSDAVPTHAGNAEDVEKAFAYIRATEPPREDPQGNDAARESVP